MAADPPDALELLERSERVRALARAILGRADGADDVAQEALIASLGWGDAGDGTLSARLAAQVRSLASRWRRTNARRARREAAAARIERSPSASELYERAELQRTLVEAVLALDEPYRECVILRYFEGLPPRAIAELRSLPVRTVQTRLARALTQLRARLERRVDLSAWVPLLAPLALRPGLSLPLPSSGVGFLAMATSKWAVSLFAVAFIGAAVFVLRPSGVLDAPGPDPVPAQKPQPAGDSSGDAVAAGGLDPGEVGGTRAALSSASEASETAAEPPPDRDLDLFGEVVDVYDQPIAGVELNVLEPDLEGERGACAHPERAAPLGTTHSDSEGRFRIRLERGQECMLEARLPGLATVHLVERHAGESAHIVLGPAATLWGRVIRASDGSGVAGAVVRLRERPAYFSHWMVCREATSDSGGSYAFDGLPAGAYDSWVTCPSDPDVHGNVITLAPGQSLGQDFVVATGAGIRGRVVDALTGEGIDRAEVSLSPFFDRISRTGPDGTFVFSGWDPEDWGKSVSARADGYASAQRALPRGRELEDDLELALVRGATVTGRILGPTGAPQPDARIEVHGSRVVPGWGRERISARSDSLGRFEVRGLSRDQGQTLVASAPGAGRLIVDLPDFDPARDPCDVGDLDLPVASGIAGRVVDASGRPVPGAYVKLQGGDPGRDRLRAPTQEPLVPFTPSISLRLDDLGRFWASDLARGEYTLTALATGLSSEAQASVSLREGERREGVELVLELGSRIAGTVLGPDGEPIAMAIIDAVPTQEGPTAAMITRPDGSFELIGLTQAEHVLTVTHFPSLGGREYCAARLEGVRTGTLDLRIVLPVADPVTGVVLASNGAPLSGASVQVDYGDGRVGGTSATMTDDLGRFRLLVPVGPPVDLVAADWRSVAEGPSSVHLGRVRGVEPGTTDLTIRIEP